jgi:hypothetical protein
MHIAPTGVWDWGAARCEPRVCMRYAVGFPVAVDVWEGRRGSADGGRVTPSNSLARMDDEVQRSVRNAVLILSASLVASSCRVSRVELLRVATATPFKPALLARAVHRR